MNSRERVRMVLNHQEPDRVPVDLWGCASRLHTELYLDICKHVGLEAKEEDRIRKGSTTEYVDYRISDMVGSDFRHIHIGKPDYFSKYEDEDGNIIDEWGVGRKVIGVHPSITKYPLENATIEDLETYKWPIARDPGRIRGLREQAKDWYENTDYAITSTTAISGLFLEVCQYLRGIEQFLMDLYINPEFARKLIEKVTELIIDINVYYLEPVAEYIEWIEFASDYGTQQSTFISPDIFRKFFKDSHIKLAKAVKSVNPDVKVFLHSCGAVRGLIPDLLEAGVEILNPIQPLATGMDSAELKAAFGDRVIFHGAVDIQTAMNGTLDMVEEDVKKRMDALKKDGGYICSPANHLQIDCPVENFFAMYEFAKIHGKY
ncbi:MAG: hypothetical protein KMY55_11305 [Dethiosulfatibacter sp.]|nr:hypothetical protein [Dethiosulfatibacter sp.]